MFRKAIVIVAGLLIAVLLAAAAGWLWSLRLTGAELPETAELLPAAEAPVGAVVTAEFPVSLPLARKIRQIAPEPGAGSVVLGEPRLSLTGYRWSRAVYRVRVALRIFRTADVPEGKIRVEFSGHDMPPAEVAIPRIIVSPAEVAPGTEPVLADRAEKPASATRMIWWGAGIGVAALLLLLLGGRLLLRRRARQAKSQPPWLTARAALDGLRANVVNRRVGLDRAFSLLTDLVRTYLEQRFQLPAATQTTGEFLETLGRSDSPLPPAGRSFLQGFLTAADLVKFARAEPDEAVLLEAIDRAGELVTATSLPDEESANGAGKDGE